MDKYFYTWVNNEESSLKFIKNSSKTTTALGDLECIDVYKKSGDLEILGTLYNRYMHLVFGVCLNYLKDEEESRDAVMQIFEELVVKLRIHQVQNFKSWLHVLTRNHCLMVLRKKSRSSTVSLEEALVENTDFVHLDVDDAKESKLTVMEACMQTLTEEQRICVDLFYLQEKCYKEIVDVTGYDMNRVKSYIQNGKRNLKICIEKNSGE
ncbi:RNA polymerase sigma-70 factor (ECF subfamily) [Pedobacter duraquae]|uniref:RNA polymerase sigma-70 factor (ECF subfamily) n=1 Tax=Pedobacter duraquae TaxID=425511 RepID=A0A4R6IGI9_9SPHI|nr:sigma-70 family RNA polymerase sigma factor [Pedobacter duraquae]TDO21473.1 RNA polymerase sigma-70 factor (ECF subfamily) [Pedobacter duraquae]